MRLATFNALHGMSLADGRVDAGRFTDAVASLDADVLGLQEVERAQPRSGGVDLTRLAAEALGAAHWRFEPALLGTPGQTWRPAGAAGGARAEVAPVANDEGGPAYGVGLVSRYPVESWHVVRLPAARMRAPVLTAGGR